MSWEPWCWSVSECSRPRPDVAARRSYRDIRSPGSRLFTFWRLFTNQSDRQTWRTVFFSFSFCLSCGEVLDRLTQRLPDQVDTGVTEWTQVLELFKNQCLKRWSYSNQDPTRFFLFFFYIQAIFINCLKRTPVKLSWNTNKYQPISSHLHNVSIFCPFWKKWKSCVWCLQFNHQSKTQVSLCLFYKPIFPKTVICFSRRPQL